VKSAAARTAGIWNRSHHLDRMTLADLITAYFQHYAVQTYMVIAILAIAAAVVLAPSLAAVLLAMTGTLIAYPIAWYALHRWVLHGRWMWRHRLFARTWKRIHYDHHLDPNRLDILFGARRTTLPTVLAFAVPIGWFAGAWGGIAVAVATGVLTTCAYEWVHCIQHLGYKPRQKWLAALKARHLAHHYHNETGNFGIVDFGLDRMLGTFYARAGQRQRSATVFNLGYDDSVASRFPFVRELSAPGRGRPRPRRLMGATPQ
jgi:hypothetical protein